MMGGEEKHNNVARTMATPTLRGPQGKPTMPKILNNQLTMMSKENAMGKSGGASKGAEERQG
jgi:hypothetical protein